MTYGTINADVIGTSVANTSLGAGNASIMKNRIINGAMVIDQRNAGASVTGNNATFPVDRFRYSTSQASKLTGQQNQNSVTLPTGFVNYLGTTSSSAYSITSTDYFLIRQQIEGYNIADLGWGTASAKTVTLSFVVQSSLTGTFGGCIANNNQDRCYPFTYTISAANTWTTISVTIAGDTTGTWEKTNSTGMFISFGLGVGSTYSGTAGSWSGNTYLGATGATSVVGTNGATFYITGVQLEVGSSATGFEYRQYGQELALCQRYLPAISSLAVFGTMGTYGSAYSTTHVNTCLPFPVPSRVAPTGISTFGAFGIADGNSGFNVSSVTFGGQAGLQSAYVDFATATAVLTQYRPYVAYNNNSGAASILFTGCEL
jgi:hypothetical protein